MAVVGPVAQAAAVLDRLPASDNLIRVCERAEEASAVMLVAPELSHWETALAAGRPILLLTVEPLDADSMLGAVMRGADAVLDCSAGPNELAAAVRTVLNGGAVLSATFTRRLAEAVRAAAGDGQPLGLTRREHDILRCIDRGETVKQTAATLGISAKTVENLQTRLFRKLGVRNRTQALSLAKALGLMVDSNAAANTA